MYVGRVEFRPQYFPSQPNSWEYIYAKVNDDYGKTEQATLNYTTSQGRVGWLSPQNHTWNKTTMRLISGSPSNGTYGAAIPPQHNNTTVSYILYFKDDLNYTSLYQGHYYVADFQITALAANSEGNITVFSAEVVDYHNNIFFDRDVKDVILHYAITTAANPYWTGQAISMNLTNDVPYQSFQDYEAKIRTPHGVMLSRIYYVNASGEGNRETSSSAKVYRYFYRVSSNSNEISIFNTISDIDLSNLTAKAKIEVSAPKINASLFNKPLTKIWPKNFVPTEVLVHLYQSCIYPYIYCYKRDVPFFITDVKNDIVKSPFMDLVQSKENENGNSNLFRPYHNVSFSLNGNPSSFPFDHYVLNPAFVFPLTNIKMNYIPSFGKAINSTWDYYSIPSQIFNPFKTRYSNIDCRIPANNETICAEYAIQTLPQFPPGTFSHSSYFNTDIEFKRNYTVYNVVLPIFGIFYLLGAVFILTNSDITNRLVLTVGIFALIFTLPQIVNSVAMKPTTSIPTIADSLLSIIVFATIAFTISSVISSSSAVQKRFPRHYTWTDGFVFILVSIVVILSLGNYDSSITIWLIPVILLGLGYGLLIRVSKTKIENITSLPTKPS